MLKLCRQNPTLISEYLPSIEIVLPESTLMSQHLSNIEIVLTESMLMSGHIAQHWNFVVRINTDSSTLIQHDILLTESMLSLKHWCNTEIWLIQDHWKINSFSTSHQHWNNVLCPLGRCGLVTSHSKQKKRLSSTDPP